MVVQTKKKKEINKETIMSEKMRKNYIVKDDAEIAGTEYSEIAYEEKRIVAELEKLSNKNQRIAMVLSIVFAGAHYYYVGRIGKGLLYTFTGGFLFIGTLLDFFMIASGRFKDKDGRYLNDPKRYSLEQELQNLYESVQRKE